MKRKSFSPLFLFFSSRPQIVGFSALSVWILFSDDDYEDFPNNIYSYRKFDVLLNEDEPTATELADGSYFGYEDVFETYFEDEPIDVRA